MEQWKETVKLNYIHALIIGTVFQNMLQYTESGMGTLGKIRKL